MQQTYSTRRGLREVRANGYSSTHRGPNPKVEHMNRRILAALLSAFALAFALFTSPTTARAEGESNEVGTCLAAGEVWLLVVTDTEEVLANECVGTPATGVDALTAAGVELERDSGGFICAMNGHPSPCPETFTGQFWGSYQGAPGAEYAFAQLGPDENEPQPGTIEAWCYNAPDAEGCTPPYLTIVQDGEEIAAPAGITTQNLPVTGQAATPAATAEATDAPAEETSSQSSSLPWGWILGGAAVVAVVVGIMVWRNSQKSNGAAGGR